MKFSTFAAAAALAVSAAAPASAALTFDWYFDITLGSGKGQRVAGTITGLEEGDNYSYVGGPLKALVTSAPLGLFLGDKEYVDPPSAFSNDPYLSFKVKDGKVTFADANLTRIHNIGEQQEQIYFGGYGGYYPALTAVNPDNSLLFDGLAPKGKTVFTLRPEAIDPAPVAVPEPATWAMLILGFGLVGALSRRGQGREVLA